MVTPVSSGEGHVPVEGCVNFRDAGGWERLDGRRMRTGLLFRADDPIRLTSAGRETVDSIGLVAAVDVRQEPQFLRSPGFLSPERTFHRPLVDRVVDLDNPPKLTEPSDLTDVYDGMIDRSREQIAEVVDLLAEHLEDGPVLVHCAYGKDRTGIIVALIQAAIGLPQEAIVADYFRSDAAAKRRYDWVLADPLPDDPPIWKSPSFLFTAPAEAMAEMLRRVVAEHGSLDAWVASFPLAPGTVDRLRAALLA